ncbi:MAG: glycoside hydrolase family 13 protein [Proteobacteria bacterium]|nr:glycoside hydrolase family 13 protein [Pseudomonadota bacterium]
MRAAGRRGPSSPQRLTAPAALALLRPPCRGENDVGEWSRRAAGLVLLLAWAACAAAPAPIERIDPPSWWVGFESRTLELMVHGPGAAALAASVDYPGVRLVRTTRADSPNYLFLDLEIDPGAAPGRVPLTFRRGGRVVARHAYPLEARRPGSRERQGFDTRDVIYLVMPDRFANGDPSNDQPPGTLDHVDRRDGGARHGGDLAGIAAHLDYLERLGVTQLWLTPVVENAQPAFSYHGYAITDHYRIDPRYGRNEDYRELARAARERGIGLIADIVVNHIGSQHWWMRDLPARDWLSTADPRVRTNHHHSTVQDPYAAEVDRRQYIDGWFSDTMPDLHPMNPQLGTYLVQNAIWWIEYADLSGLRIDTYSYSDKRFMADFTGRVRREYPRLNLVGEEWRNDPALVAYWQAGKSNPDGYVSNLPSLMDFPLQAALLGGLRDPDRWNSGLPALYERLAEDFLYPDPRHLVIFADNHDTDRLFLEVGRDEALWRMAMAWVATMRGIPQILYGTELLMANDRPGDDGDKRRDFPGGWPGDAADGFTGRGLEPRAAAAQAYLRTLLNWRRGAPAVHAGTLRHYAPEDGVYVYFRALAGETVMVALNKADAERRLALARFRESLPGPVVGRDVVSGAAVELNDSLTLPARSATVIDIR